MSSVRRKTAEKLISEMPKCAARIKSFCPHITAAAPISACASMKPMLVATRKSVSLLWESSLSAKPADQAYKYDGEPRDTAVGEFDDRFDRP